MFRSSILRTTSRLTINSTKKPFVSSLVGYNFRFNAINVRFKSTSVTEESISSIQTQLPSIDEINAASSSAVEQASQVTSMLSNQIGYLDSIGLAQSWWWPPDVIQHALEIVHAYSGLPWWGTICTVTILVRLAMFPLYVKSSDNIARNSRIKPQLDKINAELVSATELADGQRIAMKRKKLLADNGIKNRWMAAPIIQLPLALGFFGGIRHMANYPVDGFSTQGLAWFQDLTQADPYLGLQFITAAVLISFTRLGGETGAQQFSPTMKRFFTILPLVSIPATMNLSAGIVLYFAVNGFFSVMQTLILRNKWARHKLNIADIVKHDTSKDGPPKGMLESLRENMAKAKEQAERRQAMQMKEKEKQELAKKNKIDSRIKIVRKSDFNKKIQK